MLVTVDIHGKKYSADLHVPLDISIPLIRGKSPIAFGAPPYDSQPLVAGSFIGSIEEGSPVNFYNVKINPHGNGTHTESVRHIDNRGKSIHDTLTEFHFIAKLITAKPSILKNGDQVIDKTNAPLSKKTFRDIDALIIRTRPNTKKKKNRNYTDTNPPYCDKAWLKQLRECGVRHLLLDLPSVDREKDGGKVAGHHVFWNTKGEIRRTSTITEMIFVDNNIKDGLYLLNLQIISLDIDVSPSKPVIYRLTEI